MAAIVVQAADLPEPCPQPVRPILMSPVPKPMVLESHPQTRYYYIGMRVWFHLLMGDPIDAEVSNRLSLSFSTANAQWFGCLAFRRAALSADSAPVQLR